jgi:hypothetical protein
MRISDEYRDLHADLQRWGDWFERHSEDASLPHQSSHTLIYSDQPAGHKILCAEMSKTIWRLHYQILKLPERHQDALLLWYAINLKPLGGHWEPSEKAHKINLSLNAFRVRVSKARKALHKKLFPNSLRSRQFSDTNMQACITVT